jgi:hypothetical protein
MLCNDPNCTWCQAHMGDTQDFSLPDSVFQPSEAKVCKGLADMIDSGAIQTPHECYRFLQQRGYHE